MPLLATPFPSGIRLGAQSEPEFLTRVVQVASGFEDRDSKWESGLMRFSVARALKSVALAETLIAYHRACKGRYHYFRVRDPGPDNKADTQYADGRFNVAGVGDGLPTAKFYKKYTVDSFYEMRRIHLPGTVTISYDGSPLTSPAPTIDYDTGDVTFGAFDSDSVTAVTPGATTDVTLNSALSGLGVGEKLYLSGLTGTIAATLNGAAHTITNIAAAVYTLSVDTTGLAYTSGGTGAYYPQATKALKWSGSFYVPCRFASDSLPIRVEGPRFFVTGEVQLVETRLEEV